MKRRILLRLKYLTTGVFFFVAITNSFSFNYASQVPCELFCPGNLSFDLASGACYQVVTYDVFTTGDCLPAVVTQTSGLPSGSAFPIGLTQNCFAVDLPPYGSPDGDITCCFDVVVHEFPNPTTAIICNALIFLSLDEDCQYCIGAEAVLEGGPYRCYDAYLVELDKVPPFGNGPWVSNCVGAADIGKTYQVRVTEPTFGNKCWGNVKVEDKLPPVLQCRDISLPCNADPDLHAEPAPQISSNEIITYTGLNDSIGEPGSPTPDIHAYNFDFSYLPAGTPVLDVNCRIKLTGHTWLPDLNIVVTAPDGTIASLFNISGCISSEFPIDVLFDDEGATLTFCTDLNAAGAHLQCLIAGIPNSAVLNIFDGKNASGNWTVTISDGTDGDDGIIEIVGLEILVGMPQILATDNCGPVSLTYTDSKTASNCASGFTKIIHRLWTATDASGNTATCIQDIQFIQATLADVVLPVDYDDITMPSFSCVGNANPTPEWIESQNLQGWPTVFGEPVGCNIAWSYNDQVIDVCDGSYKIRRDWTIIDWCLGEMSFHNQTIKVSDKQGPVVDCPENQTVSTDPFDCCATVKLPDVIITDDCSSISSISGVVALFDPVTGMQTGTEAVGGSLTNFPGNDLSNPDTLGVFGLTTCLPQAKHVVTYTIEDNCGNTTTCTFDLTVKDYVPPVVICVQNSTLAIGLDDPFDCFGPAGPNGQPAALGACEFAGVAWAHAATFDLGSYDECHSVKRTIRRTIPYSDCILELNATNGQPSCSDLFPDFPSEFERAVSEQDSIKFYSCEAGTTQDLILRVYQLDTNGNIYTGPDGFPIYNECLIQVEVQDKIKPVCAAPSNVSVSCEVFDPSLVLYGKATLFDNCCLDATQSYQGQCGLTHTANYNNFDSLCNKGTIVRTFRAYDCNGNSSQCSQNIVVNTAPQDYYIRFPDDVIITECDGTTNYGEPTFFGIDCELLAWTYEDQVFTVVPDACFIIERNWTVINWCTFNPTMLLVNVPNPNPNAIVNHPSNLPGPVVSFCGAATPWDPTIVNISPTDTVATNYCTFWNANMNGYKYLQHIKVEDDQDPVVTNCPSVAINFADSTQNDPALWHNVFSPGLPAQNLTEVPTDLNVTGEDGCSGGDLNAAYLLFLDLDHDGTQETVVNSSNLPGADTIRYNNVNTPGFLGGTPVTFDSRPVPTNQKWHFTLQVTASALQATAAVRWNTALEPNVHVVPELPHGTHKIKWFVSDQCGNETACEHTFTVEEGLTSGIETLENDGFALYQNEPNPFSGRTTVGFRLPSAAEAKLSIFDTEGRLIFAKTGDFGQGYNAVDLEDGLLTAPAVLYYKLESGVHVAWRKMVLIR